MLLIEVLPLTISNKNVVRSSSVHVVERVKDDKPGRPHFSDDIYVTTNLELLQECSTTATMGTL